MKERKLCGVVCLLNHEAAPKKALDVEMASKALRKMGVVD
jgi:hypothetical protein